MMHVDRQGARTKVAFTFQVGQDGALNQRKRFVSVASSSTLSGVYREISGKNYGSRQLWPSWFNGVLEEGYLAFLFVRCVNLEVAGELFDGRDWYLPVPETKLYELPEVWMEHSNPHCVLQILVRLEDPTSSGPLESRFMLAANRRRCMPATVAGGLPMVEKNTFLHVAIAAKAAFAEGPRSDPGCYSCFGADCQQQDRPEKAPMNILLTLTDVRKRRSDSFYVDVGDHSELSTAFAELPNTSTGAFDDCSDTPGALDVCMFEDRSGVFLGETPSAVRERAECYHSFADDLDSQCQMDGVSEGGQSSAIMEVNLLTESSGRGAEVSPAFLRAVIKAQSSEIERLLMSGEARIDYLDRKGNSVMHFWARSTAGHTHIRSAAEYLVKAGADVNAQSRSDGMSPLHHVVALHNIRRGWLDFHKALFLLKHGANPLSVTKKGQTPGHLLREDKRAPTAALARLLVYYIAGREPRPRCPRAVCTWCDEGFRPWVPAHLN